MSEIGFDHFYCKKALQFIELRLSINESESQLASVLEFAMWLSQQIPPMDHPVKPYEGNTEEKKTRDTIYGSLKFSSPGEDYLRYKF